MKDRWTRIELRRICFLAVFVGMIFLPKHVMAAAPPDGISSRAWASIKEQIRQDQYRFAPACSSDKQAVRYRAVNPAHGLQAGFGAHGVKISPLKKEAAHWQVLMNLAGYGPDGKLQKAVRVDPDVDGGTLCYRHGPVKEWYKNDEHGLEQGFTIDEPVTNDPAQELVIALNVSGSLVPGTAPGGNQILFRNLRGQVVLRYASPMAVDADGKNLPVKLSLLEPPDQAPVSTIHISVNLKEARYPIVVDPVFISGEIKLIAYDADEHDYFGWSVAMSGDTVVVGACGNDDGGAYSGSAYIFSRNQGGSDQWGQVKKLTASDADAGDYFGRSVAISGDTVVVGAWGNDDGGDRSGSAYIFSRNQGGADQWGQVKKLRASDEAANDYFGRSVAMSGDTVVVGAYGNDDDGDLSGSAYLYPLESSRWDRHDKSGSGDFGQSVALTHDLLAVGAPEDGTNGAVYLFSRNSATEPDVWEQIKKFNGTGSGDKFGWAVDLDRLVVGAPSNNSDAGAAYLFARNKDGLNLWGMVKTFTPPVGGDALFGWAVDLNNDRLAVGVPANDWFTGTVHLYERNQGGIQDNWGHVKKLTGSGTAWFVQFGWSISLDGDTLAVGAPYFDSDKGRVYVFSRNQAIADQWGCARKFSGAGLSTAMSGNFLAIGGTNAAAVLQNKMWYTVTPKPWLLLLLLGD